jgi:hypothetical protein
MRILHFLPELVLVCRSILTRVTHTKQNLDMNPQQNKLLGNEDAPCDVHGIAAINRAVEQTIE